MTTTTASAVTRRRFLTAALAAAGVAAIPRGWLPAYAAPAQPGPSPYGPLATTPDANGLLLPEGFSSRVVARSGQPVMGTTFPWHPFPDGAGTFATDDGGHVLVSNSENPPPAADLPGVGTVLDGLARVSAIRFAADGTIVDAYSVLGPGIGAQSLCAGGPTPWGTWLACEEFEASSTALTPYRGGGVFECDPTGSTPPVLRPLMGACKHEMATCDPDDERIYLSEDLSDGLLYRFTPDVWGDLSAGVLEAASVGTGGAVTWLEVPDPTAAAGPLREQVAATAFDGGEGIAYGDGVVYLATKGDDRVWAYRTADAVIEVLYDAAEFASPVLSGVDNLHVNPRTRELFVAEDGGNLELCAITPDNRVYVFCRLTGPEHGIENPTPFPTASEVTGITFSPDGTRLYLGSQRGAGLGIVYEVTGPFVDAGPPASTTTTTTSQPTTTTTEPTTTTNSTSTTGPATTTEPTTAPDSTTTSGPTSTTGPTSTPGPSSPTTGPSNTAPVPSPPSTGGGSAPTSIGSGASSSSSPRPGGGGRPGSSVESGGSGIGSAGAGRPSGGSGAGGSGTIGSASPGTGALARTGADLFPVAGVGVAALGSGLAALAARRQLLRAESEPVEAPDDPPAADA